MGSRARCWPCAPYDGLHDITRGDSRVWPAVGARDIRARRRRDYGSRVDLRELGGSTERTNERGTGRGVDLIRILLADDEAMIRAGVRSILESDPEIEVVVEAEDGRQAIDQARAYRPDIALLDIRMPQMDGLAVAGELRRVTPDVRVVILTTFDEDEYVARALSDGASGFLLKASAPQELIAGVRAVADGAAYLSPRVAHQVIMKLRGGRGSRPDTARTRVAELTQRESDVLSLVGKGWSNRAIGVELSLVEGTVKAHVSAILQRLRVENRVQAAILAYEAGLTE